jgi:hypothetical protein
MVVQVDVENAGVICEGELHCCPHRARIKDAAKSRIVNVPVILQGDVRVREHQHSPAARAHFTPDETCPFRGEGVRPPQIRKNLVEQRCCELEMNVHLSAFKC